MRLRSSARPSDVSVRVTRLPVSVGGGIGFQITVPSAMSVKLGRRCVGFVGPPQPVTTRSTTWSGATAGSLGRSLADADGIGLALARGLAGWLTDVLDDGSTPT